MTVAAARPGRVRQLGLLETSLVASLERLRLQPRQLRTSSTRGDRLSGRGGMSTDFADYRDYAAGDDLRAVDWNIFQRLRRPYLKTFRRELDRHLVILIDASRSMAAEGKLAAACRLASALAVPALLAQDRVSVWVPGQVPGDRLVAPIRGRQAVGAVLQALAGVGEDAHGLPLEEAVRVMAARHRGRGACLLLSDFLAADARRTLGRIGALGLELLAVRILAPSELSPQLEDDCRLVDSETGQTLDIAADPLALALYQEHRAASDAALLGWASATSGRALVVSSADPTEQVVLETLRRQGWLA